MTISSLLFRLSVKGCLLEEAELPSDSAEEFDQVKSQKLPVAYVVRQSDLPKLAEFKGHVVDRKEKDDRKGLSEYCLGRDKPCLLRAHLYKLPGQLRRGVRALLSKAEERKDRNVYILGINEELFDRLQRETSQALRAAKPLPASTGKKPRLTDFLLEDLRSEKVTRSC